MTAESVPERAIVKPHRDEIEVFRSFLTAHSRITKKLEAELLAEHRLSLAAFDVYAQLAERPGRSLRMTELADALLLSRSGITRLVERLEQDGTVARAKADGDRRGVTATLTEKGLQRFLAASETHLRGIQQHFVSRLSTVELAAIGQICNRLSDPPGD